MSTQRHPGITPLKSRSVYQSLSQTVYQGLSALLASTLSHGIAPHLDAVGVVDQPVEDTIGQRGIAKAAS